MFILAMSYADARSFDILRYVEEEQRKRNVQGLESYTQSTHLAQKAYRVITASLQQLFTMLFG